MCRRGACVVFIGVTGGGKRRRTIGDGVPVGRYLYRIHGKLAKNLLANDGIHGWVHGWLDALMEEGCDEEDTFGRVRQKFVIVGEAADGGAVT